MFLLYTATKPSPCSMNTTTQTNKCVNSEQHTVTQKDHNSVMTTTITQCTPSHIPVVTTIIQREQCTLSPVVTTITQIESCKCTPSDIPVVTTIIQGEQCTPSHIPVVTTIIQAEQCTPSHIPMVTTSTVSCVPLVSTITQKELSVTVTLGTMGMKDVSVGQTASYARLAGGLGVLTAVMTLMLVGVVLGWVCSCHRKKSIKKR